MTAILTVIGFITMVGGYQLNWLFVGGVAFLAGGYLGDHYNLMNNEWDLIIFSLIISGITILLSLYFRRIMLTFACFIIGGYVVYSLPRAFLWLSEWFTWQVFVITGILASILVTLWRSWGIILLSTIGGATIVVENVSFGGLDDLSMFIVLVVIGLTAQILLWQYGRQPE